MGAKRIPAVTSEAEQNYDLKNPNEKIIWGRAVEVFGSEDLAQQWMRTPLPILDQLTPEQCAKSNDKEKQRETLAILGRIDYGLFS